MMKHYYTTIFLCLVYFLLLSGCATEEYSAIVGQIEGIVINEKTKEPIGGCEIVSQHFGSTLTDDHGRYSFSDVEPGTVQLTYKCNLFETSVREFVVSAGKTTQANVSLKPEEENFELQLSQMMLDFGNREGVIDLILKNTSSRAVPYSIKSDATEINFEPQRGTVPGNNSVIVKVAVDRSGLSEGHYERSASIITENSTMNFHIIFDKGAAARPKVTTLALEPATDAANSIIAKGSIVSLGSSNIIQHGFCFSSEPDPSLINNDGIINRGSASTVTDFSGNIPDLEYDKTYYVCAFATNQQGTSYGEVLSIMLVPKSNISIVTGDATAITSTSAKLKVQIMGGVVSDFNEIGVYYGTTENCDKKIVADINNSTNESEILVDIKGLEPDMVYYFKAYGKLSDKEKYGEIMSFKTIKGANQDSNIKCETLSATDISPNSAILHGSLSVSGTIKVKEWGFYYGMGSNPTIRSVCETNSKPVEIVSKSISQKIEKLSEATTYYFQTYAIDELNNIFKGSVESFTTPRIPTIVIDYLNVSSSIGLSGKATLYPEGNTVLEAGFIYRTDGYDLTLSSNYNGKTIKVPCEIISNTITLDNESIGGYLGGGYVRAYMILLDGTIIYNGPKIYVAGDLPYPRD